MRKWIKIFCVLLVLSIQNTSTGQLTCDYIPLEFENMTPKWNHVVIDTSIIGYINEAAANDNGNVFYNGMNHFDRDLGSFVDGEYLYSITGIEFDWDLVGYMIEKIELTTGELIWKTIVDPRTEEHSMKVMDAKIQNSKLIIHGVRSIVEDDYIAGLKRGGIDSYTFYREYDIETGDLLLAFTPDNEDGNLHIYNSVINCDYIMYGDEVNNHFKLSIHQDRGLHVSRSIVNIDGSILSEMDTVITGMYNNIYDQTQVGNINFVSKIAKGPNDTFLYLEEFIPHSQSDEETKGRLVKYDYDFNEISSFDLLQFPVKDFKSLAIIEYSEDRIVLRGSFAPLTQYNFFYYILDRDFILLDYVEAKHENEFVFGGFKEEYFLSDHQMIISYSILNDDESSFTTVYSSNENNNLDTVRRLVVIEDNWATFIEHIEQLDNGDWLIKFKHGCHSNQIYRNWYSEWMRFDEEEFDLMTSTSNTDLIDSQVTVAPNPAQDHIRIDISDDTAIDRIVIYNIQGQQMSVYHDISDATEVDISKWSSGTYILQYQLSDGNRSQVKFVKM